jgi:hypothetical protein
VLLELLEQLRMELGASTARRKWIAIVGLAGGRAVETTAVELDRLPAITLQEGRKDHVIITTLRDVVYVEMQGPDAPALSLAGPRSLSPQTEGGNL